MSVQNLGKNSSVCVIVIVMAKSRKGKRGRASGKSSNKSKKLKDPNRPKHALNSYMLFFLDMRPVILQENPRMSFSGVGKTVGKLWSTIPDNVK